MAERWYQKAVVYCLDVETFQDSDGDGVGDLPGLVSRLDYLARLGVTCLWLSPVHPTPGRDDGYDVADFYGIDPRLGSLGDFAELLDAADERGMRVMLDLVVNHTSDEHPWFRSARSSPDSPYRDWYVWSDSEPSDRRQGMVFPGEQDETWTGDKTADAWYYHRFHDFEPDLNWANPEVRAEIEKVISFWLRLGVSGFRVDGAPFIIELTRPGDPDSPKDFHLLSDLRAHVSWASGKAVLLAEANVELDQLPRFFGDEGGSANRLHMLLDFLLNAHLMLALARQDPEPIAETLATAPPLPPGGQWATFLRNHDEVDLSRLTARQRAEVFAAFGPDKSMQLYGRGIRRRLAPMLGGRTASDRERRLRLAYSLQFTLPGTPVLRYGDEIGMGEDLSLDGRYAVRTPMQWSDEDNAGFSTAPARELVRPVISEGEYGYKKLNVTRQRSDPDSLLMWFERMIRTLRECPEVGVGTCTVIDRPLPGQVLAHRFDAPEGVVLFLHNLADKDVRVELGPQPAAGDAVAELFADQVYDPPGPKLEGLHLAGYGYRWLRLADRASGTG
jgi:maltose alpha-D-glucosyltransferase/alpha-amylase